MTIASKTTLSPHWRKRGTGCVISSSARCAWLPDTCSIYKIEEKIDFSRHEQLAKNKHTIKCFSEGQGRRTCNHRMTSATMREDLCDLQICANEDFTYRTISVCQSNRSHMPLLPGQHPGSCRGNLHHFIWHKSDLMFLVDRNANR